MEKANLRELQAESSILHTEIIAERIIRKKRKLIEKQSKILGKIRILQMEREVNREKTAKSDLTALLLENLPLLFASINGAKQQITKDFKIRLIYKPCGHIEVIHLQELLRGSTITQNKRVLATEQNLFMQWNLLFEMNSTAQGSKNCEQCKKERKSIKAKFGRWNTKPIGVCHFSVGRLHA